MTTQPVGTKTANTTGSGSGATIGRATIAQNFDTFLQLLTTQLRNQSPLDPLDTNQFTQQLVQFAEVEQSLRMNQQLEAMVAIQKSSQTTTAIGFLGADVTAEGKEARLSEGKANWTLTAPRPVKATITVKAANGETVFTESRSLSTGANTFTWNGRSNDGRARPDGNYSISVTALDTGGTAVSVGTQIRGRVDSVDVTGTEPMLLLGSQRVQMSKVLTVNRP